ncbi:hypothetical protein GGR57DRAFT_501322 [Xylariaceae sp. FL1272]|nr:hypothetical protein GGR57DRAFT_501322 [Xylariaceae sp. FL1272]
MSLPTLPPELMAMVVKDNSLSLDDLKNLRATCKHLAAHLDARLFRHAVISGHEERRNAFENIANTPHLACHVCEVVWHEDDIHEKSVYMKEYGAQMSRPHEQVNDQERLELSSCGLVASFPLNWFLEMLEKFPNLTILTTTTAHRDRTQNAFNRYARSSFDEGLLFSAGFVAYMLPALKQLRHSVKSLSITDGKEDSCLNFLRPSDSVAFEALTTLQLCLNYYIGDNSRISRLKEYVAVLGAAKNLKHLTLCSTGSIEWDHEYERFLNTTRWLNCWPQLASLRLVKHTVHGTGSPLLPLIDARSLKSLTIVDCKVRLVDLVRLRTRKDVQLHSIKIKEDQAQAMGNNAGAIRLTPTEVLTLVNFTSSYQAAVGVIAKYFPNCSLANAINNNCIVYTTFDDSERCHHV